MNAPPPQSLPSPSSSSSSSSSSASNSFPLTQTLSLHWPSRPPSSSTFTTTTTSKSSRHYSVRTATDHTSPTDLSLSSLPATSTEPANSLDQRLLALLRQRKTEEAWIAYTQCTQLPCPTCLSRLVSQLSYLNTDVGLTRAQSIITRLRQERQLHRLDANSLGLLAVAATKFGRTLYATSIIKSMLRSGYLPHVKAWSAVVSRLAASGDDGPNEALKLSV